MKHKCTLHPVSFRNTVAASRSIAYRLSTLAVPLLAFGPWSADAATYYVATSGKKGNPGTLAAPFPTITEGVNAAKRAGDTVYVRGGTYNEAVYVGNSSIRLAAYPGEVPVIDGKNKLKTPGVWGALIYLAGNSIELSGFELKNSAQYGLFMDGHHNAARKMNVHHSYLNGATVRGDYGMVEDSRVWQNSRINYKGAGNGMWGAGLSAARDPVDGITEGAVLRRNVVYNNWGEGLSTFEARGGLLEDNVSYDNMYVNLYVSDASDTVVQRNLVYTTPDSVSLFGRPAHGIAMANETTKNPLNRITVINNLVYGTAAPFVYFVSQGPNTLANTLIAHNTFVNGIAGPGSDGITVVFSGGTFTDVKFVNNLVLQEDRNAVVFVATGQSGLAFSSNLWSKPPQSEAWASNDVVAADPLLTKSGSVMPGSLTGEWFRLQAASPAIDAAVKLSQVTDDYFKSPRTGVPDIGAHEFEAMAPSSHKPNIRANQTDGPITITTADSLSVTVQMTGDDQKRTDWWIVERTESGECYYYVHPNRWVYAGSDLTSIAWQEQPPLPASDPVKVISEGRFESGTYRFYFGSGKNGLGMLDFDQSDYDSVEVRVQ